MIFGADDFGSNEKAGGNAEVSAWMCRFSVYLNSRLTYSMANTISPMFILTELLKPSKKDYRCVTVDHLVP